MYLEQVAEGSRNLLAHEEEVLKYCLHDNRERIWRRREWHSDVYRMLRRSSINPGCACTQPVKAGNLTGMLLHVFACSAAGAVQPSHCISEAGSVILEESHGFYVEPDVDVLAAFKACAEDNRLSDNRLGLLALVLVLAAVASSKTVPKP